MKNRAPNACRTRLRQRGTTLRILRFTHQFRRFFKELKIEIIDCGASQAFRCQLRIPGIARPDVVPIAQSKLDDAVVFPIVEVFHIASHHLKIFVQNLKIAVVLIEEPGIDDGRAAPLWRIAEVGPLALKLRVLGCNRGNASIRLLCFAHILTDLPVEQRHIVVEHDGRTHQVCLFQPAELFPMGAVREHALEIAQDGHVDQLVDVIEKRL